MHCRVCHAASLNAEAAGADRRAAARATAEAQHADRHAASDRNAGLKLAIARAGSVQELARRLGVERSSVSRYRRCPQRLVFEMARAVGVEAATLRPDLADWIEFEQRRRFAAQSALRRAAVMIRPNVATAEPSPPTQQDLLDTLTVMQAVRFAAAERQVAEGRVLVGTAREEEKARAYAIGLAAVPAGVSSTAIARVIGCTRQNVDNCGVRYIRARDGDDPDDLTPGGRVIERGRQRKPKLPDEALWAAEARFLTILTTGEGK